MNKVSVVVTTCNRDDLLEKTINSFTVSNNYPIDEYIFVNDCGNSIKELVESFKLENYKIINNNEKKGQLLSIDIGYSVVENEYIFHLEDDWMFDTKSEFIKDSLNILNNRENIHQVWIRHDYDNPHKVESMLQNIEGTLGFLVIDGFQGVWNGFSFNPGLRRKSDYCRMFPAGYGAFKDEKECAIHLKKFNYRAIRLNKTCCYHIGYGRSNY